MARNPQTPPAGTRTPNPPADAPNPNPPATVGETAPAAERVAIEPTEGVRAIDVLANEVLSANGSAPVAGSLAEAAAMLHAPAGDAPMLAREVPGPGVGAERIAEHAARFTDRPLGRVFDPAENRFSHNPTLPSRALVDAGDVRGSHWCEVATLLSHDGVDYHPTHPDPERRRVLLTFTEYSELVGIGAVIPRSWPEVSGGV